MIFGVDTSFANGTCDWDTAAKDERVRWAYSRACYGSDAYDDDGATFVAAHDSCKRLSIPFSPYMFWLAWEDGAAQAQHFLAMIDGRYGTNAPIVDVEEGSGLHGWGATVEARIATLSATLTGIAKVLGPPMIYVNADTWSTYFGDTDAFAGHRFIIAQYGVEPGKYSPIAGIKTVVAHQFSDGSGLPPIVGLAKPDNNTDRDVAFDLAALVR
jgi:GH25 family lysozyme M1 (1,4-beta-N-acetylmuramidase)